MLFAVVAVCLPLFWTAAAMRADRMAQLRRETVDMFYHGYGNYMEHAFPEDELRPLTCSPLTRDRENPDLIGLNDALGNYSLTLIDSLSTLAILAGGPETDSQSASKALQDFQDGIAQFVLYYGDGRSGVSGQGIRARGFDLDSKVQVFETVIRGLGGLLSAHLFAIGELPISRYVIGPEEGKPTDDPLELSPISWPNGFKYDGQFLRLAFDLGQRLLPAFYTNTGIPYPRVNLRHGIPFYTNSPLHPSPEDESDDTSKRREITETCSAGAGSLTLEFTVLSRLTGDLRFEQAGKRAFWEVWNRRSRIGLIGNGIDAERGSWIGPHAGIGAGMDSFFEYALKSHILLSGHGAPNSSSSHKQSTTGWLDPGTLHEPLAPEMHSSEAFLETWHQAHASVKRYLYTDRGHYPYYSNNHRTTGQPFTMWIDSLGAFYPGLLALAGEVDEAIEANLLYTALWTRYSALPERWSILENNVVSGIGWWPGRPEFIESTYYIYRATQDPWYLYVGEMVLRDIKWRCHTPCGWAGLQDVRTGEKSDRMESFFLGETAKYLYLLFDPDHALNKLDAAYVFTTEGHPLLIPKQTRTRERKAGTQPVKAIVPQPYHDEALTYTCPVPTGARSLIGSATAARPNLFAVSRFTGLETAPNVHGPLEVIEVDDKTRGKITKYRALSNHTYFPWTLPPTMLPADGMCVKPNEKTVTWIEFPASDILKSVASQFGSSFTYYEDINGPLVNSIDGLKMQLELQVPEPTGIGTPVWRITHLGGTQLGADEIVHFYAEDVRNLKDGAFTCQRRQDIVQIHALFDDHTLAVLDDLVDNTDNASIPLPDENGVLVGSDSIRDSEIQDIPSQSLFRHLYKAVSSVFDPEATLIPDTNQASPPILSWTANTPTGPGAFPVPSIADIPTPGSPGWSSSSPSRFPWKTVFAAGQACDSPLPDTAARDHHIILMRRGGCTFSQKLDNIPSFSPSKSALQMVLVIDEYDEDAEEAGEEGAGFTRPLLETEQMTPKGMKRPFGVPMVLLQGMKGDYDLLKQTKAVGMRRKYTVKSQDVKIENALVL
ncbi:glycoside hydrolase family 47, alpha-1,2-mannosidase [Sarocladium strictum]